MSNSVQQRINQLFACQLLCLLAFSIEIFAADLEGDANPSRTRNLLADVTAHSKGSEHQLFEKLATEGGHEDLLMDLGIITSAERQKSWIGLPNGGSRPVTYDDLTWEWVWHECKRLTWEEAIGEGKSSGQILIFYPQMTSWPGKQPITIVLTDAAYTVQSWLSFGGEPQFSGARIQGEVADRQLEVRFRLRGVGPMYAITRFKVGAHEFTVEKGLPEVPVKSGWVTVTTPAEAGGRYVFEHGLTVSRVLQWAGKKDRPKLRKVVVVRGDEQISADLMKIATGQIPDLAVEAGDIIQASE